MTYGTYLRLEITAHASWRTVARAAAKRLTPQTRHDPAKRAIRHRFYRRMFEYHREAQAIVSYWRL